MYYDYKGENGLSGNVIKNIVEEGDFLSAWYTVCIYIMQMKLQPFHLRMMKHQLENRNSLTMSGRGIGKSYLLNTAYTITHVLRDRNITIAVITASLPQSKAFVSELKQYFEEGTTIYEIWGDLKGAKWSETEFMLDRTKTRKESTVTAGSMTASANLISRHFDLLILDDIVSQENSQTRTQREKLKTYIYNVVFPLLEKQSKYAGIKAIGTHYHPDDLWVTFKAGSMFKALNIPTIRKKGGQEYSIWEWKQPITDLINMREQMGTIAFNMQYQAKVIKGGSGIFKREYIQYFSKYEIRGDKVYVRKWDEVKEKEIEDEVRIFAGVDLAISQKQTADNFVISVIGVSKDKNIYLLDMYVNKLTFNEQVEAIKRTANKWYMLERIGIESVAYQQAMFQELLRTTNLPIVQIKTVKDKESRFNVFSAVWENSKIYLYYHLKYLDILEQETLNFPGEEHDDTIDSFCLAWETYKTNSHISHNIDRNLFKF